MFRWRNILWCALLLLSGARLFAASAAEKRDFNFAATIFTLGDWRNAETNFSRFLQTYPVSEEFAQAVLFEAQARFQLKQYDGAIQLLRTNQAKAGFWGDAFGYWIGEAQLAGGALADAADSFARVMKDFPASTNRLNVCLREAETRSRLKQWPRVMELLQSPESPFQQAVKAGDTGERTTKGFLLLGEACYALNNFAGAMHALDLLAARKLNDDLAWRRSYLKCRIQLTENQLQDALQTTTNLFEHAETVTNRSFIAESLAMRADVLERLGRLDESVAAYKKYLVSGSVPAERERAAMLKVAELSLAQSNISEAVQTLGNFLNHYTNSVAADVALLTLGELRLKEYLSDGAATNLLGAGEKFDRLLAGFPQGPLVGKAWLDKGWCLWLSGQFTNSLEAFRKASGNLGNSADETVARFKWADAQFQLGDFAGAITNYNYLVAANEALVKRGDPLMEQALYQTARAALEAGDLAVATRALEQILTRYPEGFSGDRTLLLTGEGFARANDPARARNLFARFEAKYPTNALISEVRLATARSYEREDKWDAAITNYSAWMARYTDSPGRTNAEFNLAWAHFKAGNETNAFELFTNFVARYPADTNAPAAQWWIADHFFRAGDWTSAELNYQLVYKSTNWTSSRLTYQAQMMAGRSALARFSYSEATNYFSSLPGQTNCPIDLQLQASFACGDALMSRTDTTNHEADLKEAVQWFDSIYTKYPTNDLAPLAWGEAGNCYLQLATPTNRFLELASNAYQQVLSPPQGRIAPLAARSQATIGLGMIAEKLAKQRAGPEQEPLFQLALERYEEVCLGKIVRQGEKPELSFVKEAGLNAIRVATENLSDWGLAFHISAKITDSFPQLRPVFESKMVRAQEALNKQKK